MTRTETNIQTMRNELRDMWRVIARGLSPDGEQVFYDEAYLYSPGDFSFLGSQGIDMVREWMQREGVTLKSLHIFNSVEGRG